jgi:chaperonin GroES
MTNLRPLHDRVVVKRTEEKEQMIGGLYIPDTAKEKPQQGQVVAIGDGRILEDGTRVPLDLNVGDQVLFGKYSGTEVKLNDEEYLIMRESDVLGVVEAAAMAKPASAR